MKKITLLFSLMIGTLVYAQEDPTFFFSFESDEGFTLGDINGQQGWVSTGDGQGTFVQNQVITDADATDGVNSFRSVTEDAFPPQEGPVIGGFYNFDNPIARNGASISFDVKIEDDFDNDGNDYRFAAVGETTEGLFLAFLVDFAFDGTIRAVEDGDFSSLGTWVEGVWYNVRVETTSTTATYFLDDTEIFSSDILTEVDFLDIRFVNDNFGGSALIDNIEVFEGTLSNQEFEQENAFVQYVNNNRLFMQANVNIDNAQIFDMSGRQIANERFNNSQNVNIDLSSFANGVYIVKVATENGDNSFKIIK